MTASAEEPRNPRNRGTGRVGVLGGGISGVTLAAYLGTEEVDVLEKRSRIGGLCATVIEHGYTFDAAGPHIMFSKNKEVLGIMVEALGGNVRQGRRENRIWYKGSLVKYPFENDLAALPKEDTFECILGYLKNPHADLEPTNLADWSYKTFGEGISDKYFIPYNRKIWNFDPKKLGLEFVARIPKPPMEDVLKSAIGIPTEGYLHQLYFYYPVEGGFEALVDAFAARVKGNILTNWTVADVRRDGDRWRVTSKDGEVRTYDTLVNTLPFHELLKVWPDAPAEARELAPKLRYNSLINVLVGVKEDRGYPYTALYLPDPEILFHRVSFPKAFSPACAPEGHTAFMAEITTNEGDGIWELTDDEVTERALRDLERIAVLERKDVDYTKVVRFTYGYPVYDLDYRANVTAMRESVEATGLILLGRFAQFDYINSDVCIERAIALASRLAQ